MAIVEYLQLEVIVLFYYDSPAGLFTIQYDFDDNSYILRLDDEILGFYHTPIAAADDVYCQHVGLTKWDNSPLPLDVPTGIDEWESP